MSEYIVDTSNIKKTEITRCGKCILSIDSNEWPSFRYCTFWKQLVPYGGFCHLGNKGAPDEEHT